MMKALVRNELRLSRRHLLVWMGMLLLLCGFSYFEYLSLKDSLDELMSLVVGFPPIIKIMFGVSGDLSTTLGWYGCIYFWAAIFDFAYAVYLGVTCVAKESAQGTAEYLFTKPVTRSRIIAAKAAACGINLLILAAFTGICNYFTSILPLGGLERKGAAVTTTIGLFLTEAVLFALALVVSSLAKSYQGAVRLGAGMLLGFYGIYIAAEYLEIPALCYLTPLKYFDVYTVAEEGFQSPFLWVTLVIAAASAAIAQNAWKGREL